MFNEANHQASAPINDLQMWTLNGNVVFNFGAKKGATVTPYILGGAGYYNNSYNVSVFGSTVVAGGNVHANNFGVNAGAGLRFGSPALAGFIEARYHYVFNGGNNLQFLPLTVGIEF
jgi:hypothetical protein